MKVAYLTEIPTPYREPLLKKLAETEGVELRVLYCAPTESGRDWDCSAERESAEFLPGMAWTMRGRNTFTLKFNPSIARRLSAGGYDVVVISGYIHPTMQIAMLWCLRHRVPYILLSESHHLTPRGLIKRLVKRPLVRLAVRGAAAFLVQGSNSRDYLVSYGADPRRMFYFPNTPDIHRLAGEAARYRREGDRRCRQLGISGSPVVLYVGRLVAVKGVDVLLRAFQQVQRVFPDAGLAIVGDGPQRAPLQASADSLGLSNVAWAGFVQPADLAQYYAAADVFVLPSSDEPWGVVVLEAMACGLPVVLSERIGCARDLVVAGENGYLVPWGAPAALAAALATILGDESVAREMGRRSGEKVQQWDYDCCIRSLFQAASVAMGSRTPPRECSEDARPPARASTVGEKAENARVV